MEALQAFSRGSIPRGSTILKTEYSKQIGLIGSTPIKAITKMAFIPKGFSLIFGRIFQRLGKLSDTQLIIVQIYVRPPFC